MALLMGLCTMTTLAQNNLDSTLVVTEIAGEEADDTTKTTTWTFNRGTVVASDSIDIEIDDLDGLEEFLENMFDGHFEGISGAFKKFGWLFALIPILLFFVLPILLVLIIVFFVYKGRKAKYRAYQQMAEKGQDIPKSAYEALDPEDNKLRADGVRTICVGIGLAILLGIIMDEVGIGIGALVFFVGVGKYVVYLQGRKDKQNKK